MVQMPPEMDPDEEPGERTVEQILAQFRADLRLDIARFKRTLPQMYAELKASLDGLNGIYYPMGSPQPDGPPYAKILEALAKLQPDVALSLEILAGLQARFPPGPPLDPADPHAR